MFTWGVFVGIGSTGVFTFILAVLLSGSCEYCGVVQLTVAVLAVMVVIPLTIMSFVLNVIAVKVWSGNSVAPGFRWGLATAVVQLLFIGIAEAQFDLKPFSIPGLLKYSLLGAISTILCLSLWHVDRGMKENGPRNR